MVIGIGGPSNAGKSALAERIAAAYRPSVKVVLLCQDDYVYPEETLPSIHGHTDWEHPATIDHQRFLNELRNASKTGDVVIAEGFLLFSMPDLLPVFDKLIFLEIDKETFLERKSCDLRWGKEPSWYVEHIWDRFQMFGQPPAGREILFVDAREDWPMDRILDFLNN